MPRINSKIALNLKCLDVALFEENINLQIESFEETLDSIEKVIKSIHNKVGHTYSESCNTGVAKNLKQFLKHSFKPYADEYYKRLSQFEANLRKTVKQKKIKKDMLKCLTKK